MKQTNTINSFISGELTPRLDGRYDSPIYAAGCKELLNATVFTTGGIDRRRGTYYISSASDTSTKAVRLIPFEYSTTQAYVLELGDYYMRVYKDGGIVLSGGVPYEIATPYAAEDLFDIKFTQTADIMYLTHVDYKPQSLIRAGHDDWTMADAEFYAGPFMEENETDITLTPSSTTGTITVTASEPIFNVLHLGSYWKIKGSYREDVTVSGVVSGTLDADYFTIPIPLDRGEAIVVSLSDNWTGTIYLQRSPDNGASWYDYLSWTANTTYEVVEEEDGALYRIGGKYGEAWENSCYAYLNKADQWGYFKVTVFGSTTSVTATVEKTLPSVDSATRWSEGAWSYYRGYPGAICFSNQRLIMGGTFYQPQTIWGSQIDDYTNFDTGTSLDDDSFAFTLVSSDVNSIRWLLDSRVLLVGTSAAEWKMSGPDAIVTPTSVSVLRQSNHGSANLKALGVGYSSLFVQEHPPKLRAITYSYQIDGWVSEEISLRAEHLLREGNVVDWDYAAKPDNNVYMVLDTGDIITCTYDRDNQMIAFSKFTTASGSFESVTSIPGTDRDEVWVVVNRTIDGSSQRTIERFTTPFWENQEDYIYMDSTLTYNGASKTTISGLDHLSGATCSVLIDGSVHPNTAVVSGTLTLQEKYVPTGTMKVHVGLPYTVRMQTMRLMPRIALEGSLGDSLGKRQAVINVSINFYRTIGCKLGINANNLETLKRFTAPIVSTAPVLYSGIINKTFRQGFEDELYITLENDQPLPFTVLSMSSTITANA